ncbi:MAG TPA: hypothetical protein VGJ92_11600 [Methanocella sp.]|jgi:hypothetical protein
MIDDDQNIKSKPLANFSDNSYTTINNIKGKLHIENDTLKRIGIDAIMSKYNEFLMLQSMAQNVSKKQENSNYKLSVPVQTTLSMPGSTQSMIYNIERTWFYDPSASSPSHRPNLILGEFVVYPLSNSYQRWDGAYLEREINLNNNDCIEFILQYDGYPSNRANLGFCIYDNCMGQGQTLVPFYPPVHVNNIVQQTTFNYELSISGNSYDLWWSKPSTGETWYYNYPDSTPSSYFGIYYASSEFNCDSVQFNFRGETVITDFLTRIGGSTYQDIGRVFTNVDTSERNAPGKTYVYSDSWYVPYQTRSRLIIANPDPT